MNVVPRGSGVVSTGLGLAWSPVVAPLPSWPSVSSPQHQAVPAPVIAQVWSASAVTAVKVVPTGSGVVSTGLGLCWAPAVAPFPRWPSASPPQQYVAPAPVSPHVWLEPADSAENVVPGGSTDVSTGLGLTWSTVRVPPLPSRPLLSKPQQNAAPALVKPQVWPPPAVRAVKVAPGGSTDVSTALGPSWSPIVPAPLPSCPLSSKPQQNAVPAPVSPQLMVRAAVSIVNVVPAGREAVATALGLTWSTVRVPPLPSWPRLSEPQHQVAPAPVRPQVCALLAVSAVNVVPAGRGVVSTGVGLAWELTRAPPLPS